jgi:hypothetical protein
MTRRGILAPALLAIVLVPALLGAFGFGGFAGVAGMVGFGQGSAFPQLHQEVLAARRKTVVAGYTPTTRPTPTVTPTSTETGTGTASPTPTFTATATLTWTPSDSPTASPSPTPTATFSDSPTDTPSDSPSPSSTASPTATFSASPSATSTASPTATVTNTFSASPTATASVTATFTPSLSPSKTSTATPTRSPTRTDTPTVTRTPTPTATRTNTGTFTRSPTRTNSPTATPTHTPVFSPTVTPTPTPTTLAVVCAGTVYTCMGGVWSTTTYNTLPTSFGAGLAYDSSGRLYCADNGSDKIYYSSGGAWSTLTFTGSGSPSSPSVYAYDNVVTDGSGHLYAGWRGVYGGYVSFSLPGLAVGSQVQDSVSPISTPLGSFGSDIWGYTGANVVHLSGPGSGTFSPLGRPTSLAFTSSTTGYYTDGTSVFSLNTGTNLLCPVASIAYLTSDQNGALYVTGNDSNIYEYKAGAWTTLSGFTGSQPMGIALN